MAVTLVTDSGPLLTLRLLPWPAGGGARTFGRCVHGSKRAQAQQALAERSPECIGQRRACVGGHAPAERTRKRPLYGRPRPIVGPASFRSVAEQPVLDLHIPARCCSEAALREPVAGTRLRCSCALLVVAIREQHLVPYPAFYAALRAAVALK